MSPSPAVHPEYRARIHRALDYLQAHLDEPLDVETLARAAHFSPSHFHRLFRAIAGESVWQLVKRVRLERAASQLAWGGRSITEVALDAGFASPATFARAFKQRFAMSASEWSERSRNGQAMSSIGQAAEHCLVHADFEPGGGLSWRITMSRQTSIEATVEVRTLPAAHFAYVRHIGPYQGDSALFARLFETLMRWAGPRGLVGRPDVVPMSMYHDDPEITDPERLRLSVGLTVPPDTETSGEIGLMEIAEGEYACAEYEIVPQQYPEAWASIYGAWLPQSGYEPRETPPLEMYLSRPSDHPEGRHRVRICVPVKPMR